MPKMRSDFPHQIVVRLTTEQDTYLRNLAELHSLGVSDVVRAIVQSAREHDRVDAAIATIDQITEEVGHVASK